jgi:hypothetical protein
MLLKKYRLKLLFLLKYTIYLINYNKNKLLSLLNIIIIIYIKKLKYFFNK